MGGFKDSNGQIRDLSDRHTLKPLSPLQRAGQRRSSSAMVAICVCLAAMLFCGVVYCPVLTAGFVNRDDVHYTNDVGHIRRTTWREAVATFSRIHFASDTGGYYQPLTSLSFMLDAWLATDWESRAFQFHLTNLLLHVLNVAILFALVRRLSGSVLWSALLALLFGLHPLQVESVAWVAQRMTLLAMLFSLLALYCYTRYSASQRLFWLAAVTLLYAAAVLSKPTFIGLPVALLVLDVWPLARGQRAAPEGSATASRMTRRSPSRSSWRPIFEKIPLFVLMLAFGAKQLWVHAHVEPVSTISAAGLEAAARNIASFASRIAWPVRLSPFYPLSSTPAGSIASILAGVPAVLLLIAAMVGLLRLSRPIFAAIAGAMVLVLPALVNVPFTDRLLGDQYLYAVLIVPALATGAWIKGRGNLLHRPWGRTLAMGLAAVAMIFAARSHVQSHIWRGGQALYSHAIEQYPSWAPGYLELVRSLIRERDFDSALFYAERAVDIDPEDPAAQFYLGRVLLRHRGGRSSKAIRPLRKALASDPNWIDCLHDLGLALAESGHAEEAISYLERARDLQPRSASVRLGLGYAYLEMSRPSSARKEFQLSLKERSDPLAHLGLARAWAANDAPEYARRHLAAAVSLDPQMAVRAAHSPELRRLRNEPGFESLIDAPEDLRRR